VTERLSNRRIRLLLGLFVLVFAGTLARAVWIQGVQASRFEGMAARQHEGTTVIPAGRGTIFDRTGEPLAIGEQATTVYADPREVKDARRVALAAAEALGVDAEKLYPVLADHSNHFVYVKRKADPAKAAALEKLNLPGLGFYAEELRYYPQRGVAAHVLGYAGIDNNGLEGLERSLDKKLVGKPGSQTTVRDPSGRVIDVIATKPERAGEDVLPKEHVRVEFEVTGEEERAVRISGVGERTEDIIGRLELDAYPYAGFEGDILAVHRAGRGERAWASYRARPWRELSAPRLSQPEELVATIARGTLVVGEVDEELAGLLDRLDVTVREPAGEGRARSLADLGYARLSAGETAEAALLRPVYLRPPAIGGKK